MKRFFPVLLAVMLVVFSVVPAMAVDVDFPMYEGDYDTDSYPYALYFTSGSSVLFFPHGKPMSVDSSGCLVAVYDTPYLGFAFDGSTWVPFSSGTNPMNSLVLEHASDVLWSNYDIYNIDDGSLFHPNDVVPTFDSSWFSYVPVNYTNGFMYKEFDTGIIWSIASEIPVEVKESTSQVIASPPFAIYKYADGFWEFVSSTDVNEGRYGYDSSFTPVVISRVLICDGTTCPASDVNFDDICDDCGMSLAYNLRVTPNEYSIVVEHSDGTTLRFSFTETLADTNFNAVYADNRITVSFDNPVNHNQYKLVDGEWTDYASYPNTYDYHSISLPTDASILSSDLDVYDESGELFFRNPLWMEMGQVTQGEMSELTAKTAGTMKILVLCGVGLMASLVVLSLFGKRSLIFRR